MGIGRTPATYSTGTIAGTSGQTVITGTGTGWVTTDGSGAQVSNISVFDELLIAGQRPLLITGIIDDRHLTVSEPLPFAIPPGTAYTIILRTVSPATTILGQLQQILKAGTDAAPYGYRTWDNGVSRLRIDFDDSGRIRFEVGATGADGSAGKPFHTAFLVDPATGNVTATGLGAGSSGAVQKIYSVVGTVPDAIGSDGDYNFDLINGLLTGPKANGTWAGARQFDLNAALKQSNAAATAASASAGAAATSATSAAASAAGAGSAASSAVAAAKPVSYGAQTLTTDQQSQARSNINAQAALGYAPALPVSPFNTQGGNGTPINGQSTYTALANVQFDATATSALIVGQLTINNATASPTEAHAYVTLYDVTTSGTLASGVDQGCPVLASSTVAGQLNAQLAVGGLVLGHRYRASLMVCTTGSINTTVQNIALSGANL